MRMSVRRPVRTSCFVPIIHSLAPVIPSSESNFTEQKVALPGRWEFIFLFLWRQKEGKHEWKRFFFFRFVCFLFSSCNDVSTDCEDCHVGVPQCQVIADQGRDVGKPVADSSKYSLWWRGGFSQVSTKRKFTQLLFLRGIKYLPCTTNSSSKCMCATSETSLTGNARKQQPAHHWRQPQRL